MQTLMRAEWTGRGSSGGVYNPGNKLENFSFSSSLSGAGSKGASEVFMCGE